MATIPLLAQRRALVLGYIYPLGYWETSHLPVFRCFNYSLIPDTFTTHTPATCKPRNFPLPPPNWFSPATDPLSVVLTSA